MPHSSLSILDMLKQINHVEMMLKHEEAKMVPSVKSTFKCQIMKGMGHNSKSNYSIIIIDAD